MGLFAHYDKEQAVELDRNSAAELQFAGHIIVDENGDQVLLTLEDLTQKPAGSAVEDMPQAVRSNDGDEVAKAEAKRIVEAQADAVLSVAAFPPTPIDNRDPEATNAVETAENAAAEADDAPEATGAAAELAEAEGVDLSEVEGSGKGGRVTKADVEAALAEDAAREAAAREDDADED